jgi:hypothetical protein
MSWQCRMVRSRIEKYAAAGRDSILRREPHLSRCPSCRTYCVEIAALEASLRGLELADAPSQAVEAEVWRRIDRLEIDRSRPRRQPRWAIAAAAAAVLVAAVLASGVFRIGRTAARIDGNPALVLQGGIGYGQEPSAAVTVKTTVARVHPKPGKRGISTARRHRARAGLYAGRARSVHRRGRTYRDRSPETRSARKISNGLKTKVQIVRKTDSAAPAPPQHAVWAAWGVWYEGRGDYARAAVAYEHAEAAADKSGAVAPVIYTYEAGRAAECAGDTSTAIEYYSKMLSRTSGSKEEPKAEKGTQIWTPSGDTA